MTTETPQLNEHNKAEYPPMHTAEHILNQTMMRTFGCNRSRINHIERKKSKCNYDLPTCPTEEQIREVEATVNRIIAADLEVSERYVTRDEVPEGIDLSKFPRKLNVHGFCSPTGKHLLPTWCADFRSYVTVVFRQVNSVNLVNSPFQEEERA